MKVYKFGGASVKDADAVRNVGEILREKADGELWMVTSAMGKSTNALESILEAFIRDFENKELLFEQLKEFHSEIMTDLFPFGENEVWNEADALFIELRNTLGQLSEMSRPQAYAAIVSIGEMLSTRIISAYLDSIGILNTWIDAREHIKTDDRYLEAKVDMEGTKKSLLQTRSALMSDGGLDKSEELLVITQGFIGSNGAETTTLGREGSDYTGGILAWCLDAEELSIWKDVPGMLNADPKYYPNAEIIKRLSYREAMELSYYGASVIHPNTLKPLQNKAIPLYVRSFVDPDAEGTIIHMDEGQDAMRPSYIFKQGQVLLSIIPLDFSFIMEENISEIFRLMAEHGLKAHLIQNSALSFSICMDDIGERVDAFRAELSKQFKVLYNQGLSLFTIRHYDDATVDRLLSEREILVEQRSRHTARFVLRGGFTLST